MLLLMCKNMKISVETLTDSMDCEITLELENRLLVISSHFDTVTFCQNNLDQMIKDLRTEFKNQRKLIQTISVFKIPLTTLRVISGISADLTRFPTARYFYSWIGLISQNNKSTNKKRSIKIKSRRSFFNISFLEKTICSYFFQIYFF